jgi:hypothetical protein
MQQDVSDDAIAKIAQAVVARLEPVVEAKFSRLEARLSTMELAFAPVGGRTIHDIHNHLTVGVDSLERLAGSYDKLCELVNTAMQNHQSQLVLQRRMNEFEDRVRGRLAEVDRMRGRLADVEQAIELVDRADIQRSKPPT